MQEMISRKEFVHAVVTDPPYHLQDTRKRHPTNNKYIPKSSKGYMNKEWDGGDISFDPHTWELTYELLPPGGHLIAFGSPRTYHRLATAIELAGFEIRDQLIWINSQGYAKNRNVSKDILNLGGESGLKSRKRISEAIKNSSYTDAHLARLMQKSHNTIKYWRLGIRKISEDDTKKLCEILGIDLTIKKDINIERKWEGLGTTLKPSYEPMVLARKPTNGSDIAVNVLNYDTGALNIDICKFEERWPTNLIHDGTIQELGGYQKYFYCAKATREERRGSLHPTIKPLSLMRWLVKLITPQNGIILDPFAGTGTTAEAAYLEGLRSIMIENNEEYQLDVIKRMSKYIPRLRLSKQIRALRQ